MTSSKVDPRNRLNDLDSSRWLQFQKSWFYFSPETLAEFITFFTKKQYQVDQSSGSQQRRSRVGIFPENAGSLAPVVQSLGREVILLNEPFNVFSNNGTALAEELDYILVDLRQIFADEESYFRHATLWLDRLQAMATRMKPNSYLTIFLCNLDAGATRIPLAWEFGKLVGCFLAMKDEKIGCLIGTAESPKAESATSSSAANSQEWKSGAEVVYCLNFRRESEIIPPVPQLAQANYLPVDQRDQEDLSLNDRQAWFIVKPPPREKNVLLHPAKFPEPLIVRFIERFTRPGERVFDPMAGTGSALVAAISCHREAYGLELNPTFCKITQQRLEKLSPSLPGLFEASKWQISCGDAGGEETYEKLPASFHYIVTSPPYWDMLRMKGAETQQKRRQAGLLQFYSDDARDLGNISDYENFLDRLVKIYRHIATRLEPGRYMTIIVKNVKKRGKIFPLAWDLAFRLCGDLALVREQFWCQDDQKLAPFGYRYAWVSNTFHHYCLHFQKPRK